MEIEDVAAGLSRVKWSGGNRFMAQCPAHSDRTASLSVTRGDTRILMYCHGGCQFTEVVAALGLHSADLLVGGAARVAGAPSGSAMLRLRRLQAKKVGPVMFHEVAEVALSPSASQLAAAWVKYPYLMDLEYEAAMKMWYVVRDGPVFEMAGHLITDQTWDLIRDNAERALRAENRRRVG